MTCSYLWRQHHPFHLDRRKRLIGDLHKFLHLGNARFGALYRSDIVRVADNQLAGLNDVATD